MIKIRPKMILALLLLSLVAYGAFAHTQKEVTYHSAHVMIDENGFEKLVDWKALDEGQQALLMTSSYNASQGWHSVSIGVHSQTANMVESFLNTNNISPENAKVWAAGYQFWITYYNP